MHPIPLSRLEVGVVPTIRKRGVELARAGAVDILSTPRGGKPLSADVTGGDVYFVEVRYEDRTLLAACTCPYFDRELEICKHCWAVLVAANQKGVQFEGPIEDLLPDDESPLTGGSEEEGVDDDAWEEDSQRAFFGRRRTPSNVRPFRKPWTPPPPPSRWRSQVASIESPSFMESSNSSLQPGAEIVYIVDALHSTFGIHLEIAARVRKKNGEWSKPRPVRLTLADVRGLPDSDREIAGLLSTGSFFYGSLEPTRSLAAEAAEFLLPKMAATGRLSVRRGDGELETAVTLEDGEPWRLEMAARKSDLGLELTGTLRRGEVSMPLSDALAVTRGGWVILPRTIAPFADGGMHKWAALLRRERVEIPQREASEFARVISASQGAGAIELPEDLRWKEMTGAVHPVVEIGAPGPYDSSVRADASFVYGPHAIGAFVKSRGVVDEGKRTILLRDAAAERRHIEALTRSGFTRLGSSDRAVSIARSRLGSAILQAVQSGWEVRGAEGAYRAGGSLDVALTSGIDWFDVEATATFGDERVRLPQLLSALQKGESTVKLADGTLGIIGEEWKKQLAPFLALAAEQAGVAIRFRRNQVLLLDALIASREEVRFDEVFDRARRRVLDLRVGRREPPESFQGELRNYQKDGLGWFESLRELGFGGCLADDMGLGKTVQVLALLEHRRRTKESPARPSLVVVPRSLVFNWVSEAARFTPELRLLDHTTAGRSREAASFDACDVVLTTYGVLRKDAALLAEAEFDYVILDEAQAIKNAGSQSAKAALLLQARHRLALSGTPVENHLGELGSLFEFLNPGMLRGKSTKVSALLREAGKRTEEAGAAREMLARAVRPFILRRTKAQVATELPDRVEQTIYCELEPKQRKLYDELRDFYRASLLGRVAEKGMNRSKMHVLEALLRLRQAACHPGLVDARRSEEGSAKLEVLFEELSVVLEERHKVIVFSQFTSLLAIVRRRLEAGGIAYAYLDGGTRDRAGEVRRFQEDPQIPVFLISLKAGGLGLNLTAAEYVFLLDPWWNPAAEAQAIDRAHRIGQTRSVFAYRLVARDTIEEKILLLQQQKRDLADAIISAENSVLRNLTAEDLDALLS